MKTLSRISLFPFSILYLIIITVWDLYWRIAPKVKLPCKVISVGNIVAGGAGKTPVAIYIARLATAAGYKTAVVARGYKRQEKELLEVIAGSNWQEVGDEPLEIYRSVPGVRVYVCESKTEAAIKAAADGAEIIIIDDGFQHRNLARDIDIVCLDSANPFGPGGFLPYGRLREPKHSLKRANALVFTSPKKDEKPIDSIEDYRNIVTFYSNSKTTGFIEVGTGRYQDCENIRRQKSIAFCGLANPNKFQSSLGIIGIRPLQFKYYDDHHRYSSFDIDYLIALLKNEHADCFVTTLKDAVKFDSVAFGSIPIYYAQMSIELNNDIAFKQMLGL
jgi:tetraacyldisaccharide 4'-kinase